MGLLDLLEDMEYLLGRELTQYEIRIASHSWVNGYAEGVYRTNKTYMEVDIKEDTPNTEECKIERMGENV